jgi:hypothetical protein
MNPVGSNPAYLYKLFYGQFETAVLGGPGSTLGLPGLDFQAFGGRFDTQTDDEVLVKL